MSLHTPAVAEPAQAPPRPRLAYIDNLRIFLTALVVIHHAAVTYGNIPGAWYYIEPATDSSGAVLDSMVMFNQAFFMGFFFMIAGVFVPGSVDRKGPRGFLRGRLTRLGIPLLLFLLLARPIVTLPIFMEYRDVLPYWAFYILSWDPGPLWFVELLLIFSLGYLVLRRRGPRPEPSGSSVPGRFPGPLAIVGFTAALSLVTIVWRFGVPRGTDWPFIGIPSPAFMPQYLGLFIIGVVAFRKGWFAQIPRAAIWWGGAMALVSGAAYLPVARAVLSGSDSTVGSFAAATIESVFAVSVIVFLLALFQRAVDRQGPVAKFLSDNAFGVYFLHALVLVGVGLLLHGWEAPAIAKFAVLVVLGLPLSWGAAWLLRRIPVARRVF